MIIKKQPLSNPKSHPVTEDFARFLKMTNIELREIKGSHIISSVLSENEHLSEDSSLSEGTFKADGMVCDSSSFPRVRTR